MDTTQTKDISRKGILLYVGAIMFLPNIFLFFLINQNIARNPIRFDHALVLAAAFAIISLGLFFLFRLISRSYEGAMVSSLLFWVFFWLFESMYRMASSFMPTLPRALFWLVLLVIVLLVTLCFRRYDPSFHAIRPAFLALSAVMCVLFVFNLAPGVRVEIAMRGQAQGDFYIKQQFVVDDSLPSPDIYWFHVDGMVNFAAIEEFFGDGQEELRAELTQRGFVINEDADLHTGVTIYGIPALKSPAFYDSWLGAVLADTAHLLAYHRFHAIDDRFTQDGICIANDVAPNNELFQAFSDAEYTRIMIGGSDSLTWPNSILDFFYATVCAGRYPPLLFTYEDLGEHFWQGFGNLIELLSLTTPLPKNESPDESLWALTSDSYSSIMVNELTADTKNLPNERSMYAALIDSFSIESPKLVTIVSFLAHGYRWMDVVESEDIYPFSTDAYLIAHQYAIMVMLRQIDLVLENNPNAVIVLQAEHGLNLPETYQYLLIDRGLPLDDLLPLFDGVFSAVRIPPQYGGLDEPLDPRNISRILVNRFVGENYQLLEY
ncbi:MAG: hypothetical protein FWE28_03550 [Oscillospiraceae bacterium]|nr:hypothetical protein [Oscillospiraceae bacterium]